MPDTARNVPVILQVIPELDTGGAERTAVDMAAAILGRGWKAIVVSEGGRLVEELEALGAEHITLPVASKNPLTIWKNAAHLEQISRERGVSLLHARSRAPAWSAYLAARRLKLPFVTTYHGIYNQKGRLKAFYNSVMARGDAVIANSGYTAEIIRERHAFASERITVVHRGSDLSALAPGAVPDERVTELRAQWGVPEGVPVILQLARLTNWKGQKVVIDAMAELEKLGFSKPVAVLAGDAQGREAYVAELESRIREKGLTGRVLLVGHCADVPAAMAVADISVVASIEPEAFGRAAVEAQASGTPVIVSDLGAVPETVLAPPQVREAERTGWRVAPGDAEALGAALARVLEMPERDLEALTTRALAHVRARFSVEAMCSATLKVYDSVLINAPNAAKQ